MPQQLQSAPNGLHGELTIPGDKSISHRAVMLGAISHGQTIIHHFLDGQDCLSTVAAFQQMGVTIKRTGKTIIINGQGIDALSAPAQPLNMGNSGTTTRLLMGILAGRPFNSQLIGDASLQKRPMARVSQPLKSFGGHVELSTHETLPAKIIGHSLHHADVQMKVASAQVKSALIFAALQANETSTVTEVLPTRNHTEIMLNQFGAEIATNGLTITAHPHPHLVGQEIEVPGDISSAAFFLVAGAIVPHSKLTLNHVNLNPTRTGIVKVLKKMGAKLTIEHLPSTGEPLGDLTIESSNLSPVTIGAADIPALIDELPLVALLGACANGQTTITGAQELRVKETDRIKTVVQELRKLGVHVKELPDGMIIDGQSQWQIQNNQLDSYGDHRIGMMDAVAALKSPEPLTLTGAGAVSVSYPGFFNDLQSLIGG